MLVELRVVEQRHKAVLEVLDGAWVTEVAHRYGVVRKMVHDWLRRYAAGGMTALADRSSRPDTAPTRCRRRSKRGCRPASGSSELGPRTLVHRLGAEGVVLLPGRSSVYRALIRHGLIDPKRRKRRRSTGAQLLRPQRGRR